MTLLCIIVLAASITVVFTRGSIFERVREHGPELWQELSGCPLCAGQWIGMLCALALLQGRELSLQCALTILGTGSATGVLAFGIAQLFDTLGAVEDSAIASCKKKRAEKK